MPVLHVSVEDLRPGMYIVDMGLSWIDHPYLYAKEGLIRSHAQIVEIIHQGFSEAYYDTEKSNIQPAEPITLKSLGVSRAVSKEVPLGEELEQVENTYSDCVRHAKEFMLEARNGTVDLEPSRPLVQGIIDSVNRNMDALKSNITTNIPLPTASMYLFFPWRSVNIWVWTRRDFFCWAWLDCSTILAKCRCPSRYLMLRAV